MAKIPSQKVSNRAFSFAADIERENKTRNQIKQPEADI